jgi:hypothetical protein
MNIRHVGAEFFRADGRVGGRDFRSFANEPNSGTVRTATAGRLHSVCTRKAVFDGWAETEGLRGLAVSWLTARFRVLSAVLINTIVFCDVTPCWLVQGTAWPWRWKHFTSRQRVTCDCSERCNVRVQSGCAVRVNRMYMLPRSPGRLSSSAHLCVMRSYWCKGQDVPMLAALKWRFHFAIYASFWALACLYRRVRKVAMRLLDSSCLSFPPSVRTEQLGCHWTDVHDAWYMSIFRKYVDCIQVWLKSDKNNVYFTWTGMHIHDIWLNSS